MSLWGKTDNTDGEPKFTSHHEGMDSSNFTMYGVDTTEQGVAILLVLSILLLTQDM